MDNCRLEGQTPGFHCLATVFEFVGKLGLSLFGGIDLFVCLQLSLIALFGTGQHDHY